MNKRTKALLQANNQSEKQLSDDSQQILTDIVVYLRTAPISLYQQETVRRDITYMLLDGEMRGDNAKTIIGNDYQAFCDSVIAELPPLSSFIRALSALRDVLPATIALLLIWLAGQLAEYASGLARAHRNHWRHTRWRAVAHRCFSRGDHDLPHDILNTQTCERSVTCSVVCRPVRGDMRRLVP